MDSIPSAPYALAVDDDGLIRLGILDHLEAAGFRTLEAENGDQAIAVLEQHQASIILMFTDVQMPGSRDGFALAREAHRRWPHISIVVASGQVRPQQGDLPAGTHFISKPFSVELINAHLQGILLNYCKLKALKQ